MKAMLLLIALSCLCSVYGQATEERVKQVLSNLECKESKRATAYEGFVDAIERGERGEGIRYPWMDKMRQLGIKQAFFVVHFSYKNGEYRYKVKRIDYLRRYYCYEDEVKGGKLIRKISKSGLEKKLKKAVIAKFKKSERRIKPGMSRRGRSIITCWMMSICRL